MAAPELRPSAVKKRSLSNWCSVSTRGIPNCGALVGGSYGLKQRRSTVGEKQHTDMKACFTKISTWAKSGGVATRAAPASRQRR